MDALRGRHFSVYRDTRLSEGVTGATVRLELAIISHLYTHAAKDWGFEGLQNPIEKMKLPSPGKGRRRRLQEGEEAALLAACDEVDKRQHKHGYRCKRSGRAERGGDVRPGGARQRGVAPLRMNAGKHILGLISEGAGQLDGGFIIGNRALGAPFADGLGLDTDDFGG